MNHNSICAIFKWQTHGMVLYIIVHFICDVPTVQKTRMLIYAISLAIFLYLHNWKMITWSAWAERNDLVGVPSGWFVLARSASMMRVCGRGVSACGGHRVRWCDVLSKTDLGKGLALTPQCFDPALSPMLAAIITSLLKNDCMVLYSFVSGFTLLRGLLHLCHVLFGCANLATSPVRNCSQQVINSSW